MPKLAEALVERKSLQERFARLQTRLSGSAKVQEGETPDEPPAALLDEADRTLADIKRLTIQINRTNSQTVMPNIPSANGVGGNGQTIMEAIAERDRLLSQKHLLDGLNTAARVEPSRQAFGLGRNEVKWHATIDVGALQKQIDAAAQAYRILDTRIQEVNWTTELIET